MKKDNPSWRAWFLFLRQGLLLGFIIGLFLVAPRVNENFQVEAIITVTLIGGALGSFGGWLLMKVNMDEKHVPFFYCSPDSDYVIKEEKSEELSDNFSILLLSLANQELITMLSARYYRLSDEDAELLIAEIKTRKLTPALLDELYQSNRFYKNITPRHCPCCAGEKYFVKTKLNNTNCLICGWHSKLENPKSLINRFSWKMGFLGFSKLSLRQMKELLFVES